MSVWLLILTKSNATIIYLIFLISVFFNIFFQICPFIFYLLTFIWFVSRVILFCKFIFKVHTQSCYHFFFYNYGHIFIKSNEAADSRNKYHKKPHIWIIITLVKSLSTNLYYTKSFKNI